MYDLGWLASRLYGQRSNRAGVATRTLFSLLLIATVIAVPFAAATSAKANTLQMSADSDVSGWYPNEAQLTPASVTGGDFGEIFDTQLNGQVYAQPLVSQPTVLAVTENNYAYGLNATTGAITWQDFFGAPDNPLLNIGCGDVGTSLGITGTPVIDSATGVAYFVAAQEESGETNAYFMEAVNVQTGAKPSGWPSGGVPIVGSADGDSATVFNANYETQRPGLVLVDGVIYASFGSQCDYGSWEGWVVGVSESSASITTMWSTEEGVSDSTAYEPGAGIWQSGSAPVVDANGDIFVDTGNGEIPSSAEPGSDVANETYGEAVIKLHTNSSGQLKPVDWFIAADAQQLNNQDGDLGSGGPVALPVSMGTTNDPNPMVVDGKQGILYTLNMNDLGGYQQGLGGADDVESETGPDGGVWSKAGVWPGDGGYIYLPTAGMTPFATGGGSLNAYQRTDTSGTLSFPVVASTVNSGNTFGFGTGAPIVTSNGTTSGSALLWIIHATGASGADSQLEAFNPVPMTPGSGGTLEQLWSSTPFTSTVFSEPSVDNGVLYVGTKDDTLLGFGALPSSTPSLSGSGVTFPPTVVAQSANESAVFTASAPTTVSSFTVSGGAYSMGTPSATLPTTLSTGQTISVPITFTPNSYGANPGTLTANLAGATASISLSGQGDTTATTLSIAPSNVVFAPRLIGSSSTSQSVTVTNASSSVITVSGFTYPAAPFYLNGAPTTPLTLQPNGSANDSFTFTVQFNPPGSSGDFDHDFNSSVTIKTSAGNFGVAIAGSADPPAQITTVPATLNFGNVAVGTSATMNFELGDQGGFPLTITLSTPPTTNGFTALTNPFTQLANTTPSPYMISADSAIPETVQFTPTSNGLDSATWIIEGNDGSGVQSIALTGTGYTPAPPPPSPSPGSTTATSTTTTAPPTTTTTVPPVIPNLTISVRAGRVGVPLDLRTTGDAGGGALTFHVRNGTAKGCRLHGALLTSKSPGTCVVTATRAASSTTAAVTSRSIQITFTKGAASVATPSLVLSFRATGSALDAASLLDLASYAKALTSGVTLVITGYAPHDAALAISRADAVARYLSRRANVVFKQESVTNSKLNEVTIK